MAKISLDKAEFICWAWEREWLYLARCLNNVHFCYPGGSSRQLGGDREECLPGRRAVCLPQLCGAGSSLAWWGSWFGQGGGLSLEVCTCDTVTH